MKRKGFTLVELLGVITVLIIVLGMVVVGYIKVQDGIRKTYYHSQEDSILMAATEYYNYNENKIPKIFGDAEKISLQELITNGYIEDVLDRNKNDCDLNNSSVIAYRDSYEKIQYEVCLVCPNDKYKTENDCETKTIEDYGLQVNATIGNTTNKYKEGTWTNQDVWLTFKTGNDAEYVEVKGTTTGTKSCNLTKINGVKTCKIKVDSNDTYSITGYGANNNPTETKTMNILIDKTKPTYTIKDPTGLIETVSHLNDEYIIDFGSDNIANVDLSLNIIDILDTLSGIDGIRYSLEKQGNNDKYTTLSINNNQTTFTRNLTNGTWILKVDARDIAGNKTVKTIKYYMYQKVSITTNSYCIAREYNDTEQVFVQEAPVGRIFTNTKGINAGNYTVTASLKDYYAWESGERRNDRTFVCTITQRPTTCTSASDSKTYDGNALTKTSGGNCSNLVSGHSATFTNTGTITDVGNTANTISNIVINRGGVVVTSNYNITRQTGTLTINKRTLNVVANNKSKTYGDSNPTFTHTDTNNVSGETPGFSGSLTTSAGNCSDVGNYDITQGTLTLVNNGKFKANNYQISYTKGTLSIERKTLSVKGTDKSKVYGTANPAFTYTHSGEVCSQTAGFNGGLTTSATTNSNVGRYNITQGNLSLKDNGTFKAKNYSLSYTNGILTITQATPTLSLSSSSGTLTYGTNGTSTITTNGDGTLSCASNNASVATCSISGKTLTIIPKALNEDGKTATITVSHSGGTNYSNKSVTYTVTVNRQTLSCSSVSGNTYYTYDGGTKYSGISCPSGTSTGGTTSSANPGDYTQTCTANTAGYKGTCNAYWKVTVACTGACNSYSNNFSSIQGGVNSISTGAVAVTASHTIPSTVVISNSKNITLDLNGKTVSATDTGIHIAGQSTTVRLKNGTFNSNSFFASVHDSSTIIIESGNYNTNQDGIYSVGGQSGNIIIQGGTIDVSGVAVNHTSSGTLTISGGSLKGGIGGITVGGNGTLNMTNGTVDGGTYNGIAFEGNGRGTITGGTIKGHNVAVFSSSNGTATIGSAGADNGNINIYCYGTFISDGGDATCDALQVNGYGTVRINSGTLKGLVGISNSNGTVYMCGGSVKGTGTNGIYVWGTGSVYKCAGSLSGTRYVKKGSGGHIYTSCTCP